MDAQQAVERAFQNLTLWRNLPKYQLERRADIFFSLYLKEIVESKLNESGKNIELLPVIIPEFPLRHGKANHTVNVDYVMFSKTLATVYLIEFKTDMGSLREEQFEYLFQAKAIVEGNDGEQSGFKKIVKDLCSVFGATSDKQKYFHLFNLLESEELGLISMSPAIKEKLYSERKQGVGALIESIQVTKDITSCEIIFLQPARFSAEEIQAVKKYDLNTVKQITFGNVVNCLKMLDSPFAEIFARYVGAWTPLHDGDMSYCAGARTPKTIDDVLKSL